MHHPTDRIAHTTAFVTPVVEHWRKECIKFVYGVSDKIRGARCSSGVRAFTYGALVRRIDPSWWIH